MKAQVLEQNAEHTLQEAFKRLPFLEPVVKDTLEAFVRRLREVEGENLLRVVLFGSMARGDSDEESDTDVFVLLREGELSEKRELIVNLAYDASYGAERYVLLSPFVETESDLKRLVKGFPRWNLEPVFEEIREDGIPLFEQGIFIKERI